jgi:hypothetical protein
MNFFFRSITAIIVLSILCHAPLFAQIEPFGLAGEKITSISLFPTAFSQQEIYLCAGSDSNGIFIRNLVSSDSPWVNFGLADKKITTLDVYHWGAGPASLNTIFAGVQPEKAQGDSTFLYRYTFHMDTAWFAADSGLDAGIIHQINSIAGFFFEGHEPPQPIFLGTDISIYRAVGFPPQLKWNDTQTGGFISVIKTSQPFVLKMDGHVWAGGQNDISFPIFFKSIDGGLNWEILTPTQWHPNGCYSLVIDPQNPDTVYAGLAGFIIKTGDGGLTWISTALQNLPVIFNGLVIDPNNSNHLFAGGTTFSNEFVLYETMDGGDSWTQIAASEPISGISSMSAQTEGNKFVVYIGTFGDGPELPQSLQSQYSYQLPVGN